MEPHNRMTTPTFPKPAGQRRRTPATQTSSRASVVAISDLRDGVLVANRARRARLRDVGAVEGHRYMVFEGCGCDRAVVGPVGPQDRQA